jgi:tRNA-specific 2-thiouridylase
MSIKEKVVVALSGGVDSSVAAALLKEQGYEVIGLTMRLWTDPVHFLSGQLSPAVNSETAARRLAETLDIPLHVMDITAMFRREIVQFFLDEYERGVTPNPCVRCNRLVKWGVLLEQALALGADFLATGHYARKRTTGDGRQELLRAVDPSKDQTYVLHVLTQNQLKHALFPTGGFLKTEIRDLARKLKLPAATREDSQDLCFLAGEDYRDFIRRNAPQIALAGLIQTRAGKVIGEHRGLVYYTIGQRKGLGISSPVPLYVLAKDVASNTLIVGVGTELGSQALIAQDVNWIAGQAPGKPFHAQVKTRYTAREARALVEPLEGERVRVLFEAPQRDITPGQAAVFYAGDILLGGGLIQDYAHSQYMI